MTEESMNIHKALCELKILDDRIHNAINTNNFVVAVNKTTNQIDGVSIEQYANNIKAANQKIQSLISRRSAIKRAVVLSNATTEITVAGRTMTVAEAIDERNNGIALRKSYLTALAANYHSADCELKRNSGENLQNKCEAYIQSLFGVSDNAVNPDAVAALKQDYIRTHEYMLVDPIGVLNTVSTQQEYCDNFFAEVDSALSTSNALTVINIKY